MDPSSPPVVIAGAGPVGLAMATGLAHHRVPSIVLEEDDELSRHSKAAGILPRTLEIFRAWGVLERFLGEGTFLTRARIWLAPRAPAPEALEGGEADRRRRPQGTATDPGPHRSPGAGTPVATVDLDVLRDFTEFPGFLFLPQDKTERLLYEHVSGTGLADVRFGHRVVGFDQRGSGVTVRVEPRRAEAYEIASQYLIGCDGAHSVVRGSLGWSLKGKTYPTRLMLADVRLKDQRNDFPWPRVAAVSEGVLAALRIEPELWRIIATLAPEADEKVATGEPELARRVELLFGRGPFERVWAEVFRIHCRNSPHFRAGRVFLAGDAAHLNSPAGGMGMNSGIQDAHNLAWKLARGLAGGGAGHGDPEALLASYEEERRPAVLTDVDRYTDLLTRGILLAPTAVRTLFLGAAGIALRRRRVMRRIGPRIAMLDTRYRSRLISGRGRLLGSRAPDGAVSRGDGEERRLLDLVGREPALLLFDDGCLPGWNVRQVESLLGGIPELKVYRLLPPWQNPLAGGDLVDVTGAIGRSWRPSPGGTAALIRPDGHVGWMADRASPEDLREGVGRALGG